MKIIVYNSDGKYEGEYHTGYLPSERALRYQEEKILMAIGMDDVGGNVV